jgi:hypothetical protein
MTARRLAVAAVGFALAVTVGFGLRAVLDTGFPTADVPLPTALPSVGEAAPSAGPDEGVRELVIAADGLFGVKFGEPADAVIPHLTQTLGEATEDATQPCESEEDIVRVVRWENLALGFRDGSFTGYTTDIYSFPGASELPLRSEDGLALRVGTRQLAATFGDRIEFGEPEGVDAFPEPITPFGIDGYAVGEDAEGIGGFVEGGQAGQVIIIMAGRPC